jgi:MFS family permease
VEELTPSTREQDTSVHDNKQTLPAASVPPQSSNHLLRAFSSLRQRNFRLYWFGQMISLIGSWMQSIGQAWLVLEITHSGWQLGLVGALQALPVLLFSLFGGVFADHWPKRRVLLLTQSAAMIQALLFWLLIVTGTVQLWHIYVLALLLGLTNCLSGPTRQAFVIEMVGRKDLPNAIGLNSTTTTLARIVGPGIGGVIIAVSGTPTLFLLNALSFLAAIAGLALIDMRQWHIQTSPQATDPIRQSTLQRLYEGIIYVWKTPPISLLLLIVGLILLFGSNFNVVLPLLATNVLHVGATGYGFMSATLGLGSLLSALWLAWYNQTPTIRHVLIGALLFGLLETLFALAHIYLLSLILITGVGFAENIFASQGMTALQTTIPDHLRGRVISIQILCFDGSLPLGYLLVGWLAGICGASLTLLICALICLLIAAVGWLWHRSIKKDQVAFSNGHKKI